MTQRIFNAKDDKDVKELFDLLPDRIVKAIPGYDVVEFYNDSHISIWEIAILNINWNGLTEIHRPVSYEKYIGKLGIFCGGVMQLGGLDNVGILVRVDRKDGYVQYISSNCGHGYDSFRPLTQKEAKELIG